MCIVGRGCGLAHPCSVNQHWLHSRHSLPEALTFCQSLSCQVLSSVTVMSGLAITHCHVRSCHHSLSCQVLSSLTVMSGFVITHCHVRFCHHSVRFCSDRACHTLPQSLSQHKLPAPNPSPLIPSLAILSLAVPSLVSCPIVSQHPFSCPRLVSCCHRMKPGSRAVWQGRVQQLGRPSCQTLARYDGRWWTLLHLRPLWKLGCCPLGSWKCRWWGRCAG